ncbi:MULTISPECIES: hypothetical protein [unclassified Microcoleus]|uniref:hypothetical protein n=1 Tax=unclassified Microcoleus TaxID=2642155 RepID=UPI002FD3435F
MTYKVGDRVKLKRKTPHAACLKKGDIVTIDAIHPQNGSCKFWNELTKSWGYLYPDEFVLLPPDRVDSPTAVEVAVGESNPPHSETDTNTQFETVGESPPPPGKIDSPTLVEVAVGESNCLPDVDGVVFNSISTYRPRGTARGGEYYRLSYKDGGKVRQVHIRGGNTDSPIAQAKVAEVRSLLAIGISPSEVATMLRDGSYST